jgi:hypothetical protein
VELYMAEYSCHIYITLIQLPRLGHWNILMCVRNTHRDVIPTSQPFTQALWPHQLALPRYLFHQYEIFAVCYFLIVCLLWPQSFRSGWQCLCVMPRRSSYSKCPDDFSFKVKPMTGIAEENCLCCNGLLHRKDFLQSIIWCIIVIVC